jgi:phage terminase large subunit-like protein
MFVTAPRGGNKSSGVAALLLVSMVTGYFPAASRSYVFAVDRDQARIVIDLFNGWIARTPALAQMFTVSNYKVTCKINGSTVEVIGSDSGSAFGLLCDGVMVVDEFAQFPLTANSDRLWEAILSTVLKVPTCRLITMTTPGAPGHPSARVWSDAVRSPLWWTQQVKGPLPWLDPEELEEMRNSLPSSAYARLYLGEWQSSSDALVTEEDMAACLMPIDMAWPISPSSENWTIIGLDVGTTKDRTAAVVVHRTQDGHVVIDDIGLWAGTAKSPVDLATVRDWLVERSRRYGDAPVWHDPHEAKMLSQELVKLGVAVIPVAYSPSTFAEMAMTLHGLLKRHLMVLPHHPEFLSELASVRLKDSASGTIRIDTSPGSSQHDDMVMALAYATRVLAAEGTSRPVFQDETATDPFHEPALLPTPIVPQGVIGRPFSSMFSAEGLLSPVSDTDVIDISQYQ